MTRDVSNEQIKSYRAYFADDPRVMRGPERGLWAGYQKFDVEP